MRERECVCVLVNISHICVKRVKKSSRGELVSC